MSLSSDGSENTPDLIPAFPQSSNHTQLQEDTSSNSKLKQSPLSDEEVAVQGQVRGYQQVFVAYLEAKKITTARRREVHRAWMALPVKARRIIGPIKLGGHKRVVTIPQVTDLSNVKGVRAVFWILAHYPNRPLEVPEIEDLLIKHGYKGQMNIGSIIYHAVRDDRVIKEQWMGNNRYSLGPIFTKSYQADQTKG